MIGEEVKNPIRIAQDAYAQDKAISILLINDGFSNDKIKQALLFSPFIGPTVQCISNEAGARMAPIVEDAMQRTMQRRNFAKMKSSSLNEQIESEEGKGTTFMLRLKEYIPEEKRHTVSPA